jgi:hypothetical protein
MRPTSNHEQRPGDLRDVQFENPLVDRFGSDAADVEFVGDASFPLDQLAARGSVRKFRSDPIPYVDFGAYVRRIGFRLD